MAIIENDTIVGHVPRTISVPCDLFLKKGGTISCVATGPRQYSRDLGKGGLNGRVQRKIQNGYTGNYEDIYFRGLIIIREILNNYPYGMHT